MYQQIFSTCNYSFICIKLYQHWVAQLSQISVCSDFLRDVFLYVCLLRKKTGTGTGLTSCFFHMFYILNAVYFLFSWLLFFVFTQRHAIVCSVCQLLHFIYQIIRCSYGTCCSFSYFHILLSLHMSPILFNGTLCVQLIVVVILYFITE
jgi:hypothetical protein